MSYTYMVSYHKTICVDFDRTIHKYSRSWVNGRIYDEPVDGAIKAIKMLKDRGFKIIICTARSPLGEKRNGWIRIWLEKHGLKDIKVTFKKPRAIAYIDDRAIRFTNWRDILNYFL